MLVLLLVLLAPPGPAQETGGAVEESRNPRSFALPLARSARDRAEEAMAHLTAEPPRWNHAIDKLQEVLETSRDDLLPTRWRQRPDQASLYASYPGATAWAARTLRGLPEEARRSYRTRHDATALQALSHARTQGGRGPLVEVAMRWPLSTAAELAWWTLGDLELERGHPTDAGACWRRARDLRVLFGEDLPPGAQLRLDLARAALGPGTMSDDGGFRGGNPTAGGAARAPKPRTLPPVNADSWTLPLDLSPFAPGRHRHGGYNLAPTLTDDRVLVNTTMRVYAVDAFTGKLAWSWGPDPRWRSLDRDEYFSHLAVDELILRPAAQGGVVVAAIQIPYTERPDEDYQDISIFVRIPERRLYAFDLETGRELWNHCPDLQLDTRDRGNEPACYVFSPTENRFAQRMIVAASPVIAGPRVLVPCYALEGCIAYHVACYELSTGELLWKTPVISGQRERNMFGRAMAEFVAAPITVAGDVAIAQTDLGSIAALDLYTGELLWESEYDQIPLPINTSHRSRRTRTPVWQVTPPCVTDDVIVSTPNDSETLVALELEDGRVLWDRRSGALPAAQGTRTNPALDRLVGVDGDTIYLSGRKLIAVQAPGGLRTRGTLDARWDEDLYERANSRRPPPILVDDRLLVPHEEERLVIDRWTGHRRDSLSGAWSREEYGNAVVGDGVLFTLGRRALHGYFDWKVLLDRQRALLAAAPGDEDAAMDMTRLLVRYARSIHAEGDTMRARNVLREAHGLVDPLFAGEALQGRREVVDTVHGLLLLESQVLADLADSSGALRALRTARPLAPTVAALSETLLQEERLLRGGPPRLRMEVLALLEAECGEVPLPARLHDDGPAWLIGEAIVDETALGGWEEAALPLRLWVLLTRAGARARQHDGGGALRDLHIALDRFGAVALNESLHVADLVIQRIDRRLEMDGRAAYAPFEREAATLLDQARSDGDRQLLDEVARRYPHSGAARDAHLARLERAYLDGEARELARLVFNPDSGTALDEADRALGFLQLGLLLARDGNATYLSGLVEALGARGSAALARLSAADRRELETIVATPAFTRDPHPTPQFTPEVGFAAGGNHEGQFDFIGAMATGDEESDDAAITHVYLERQRTLYAFRSTDPLAPAWAHNTVSGTGPVACKVDGDHVYFGSKDHVQALNSDGELAWRRSVSPSRVRSLSVQHGVVVVEVGTTSLPEHVVAFDAATGVRLWSYATRTATPRAWRPPVLGEGYALFLIVPNIADPSAIVVDLFTGEERSAFSLDRIQASFIEDCLWIQDGKLFVPSFRGWGGRPPYLAIHDLETGRRLWRHTFDEGELFHSVVSCAGRNYVVTQSARAGRQGSRGGIFEVNADLQALRPVVALDSGESPIGIRKERRVELHAPFLFVYPTDHAGSSTPIRAIHLPRGQRWSYQLPVGEDELYDSLMPVPAVAGDCVAFAYVEKDPNSRLPRRVMLEFVDLADGYRRDSRALVPRLHGGVELELRGLGDSLFVVRNQGRSAERGIDVLVEAK